MTRHARRRCSLLTGLLTSLALVAGCLPGPPTPPSPDVWALVDGQPILRDEVETAFNTAIDPAAPPASNEESLGLKLDILEELIAQHLLLERARALDLMLSAEEVEAAVAEQREAMTPEVFESQLAASGLTVEDFRAGLERELSVQRLLEAEVFSKVSVTDREVAAYFEQNREQFNLREPQYRLARIVVTPQADPGVVNRSGSDATTPAEAQAKIEMLREELSGGADFGELALDYSEDAQTLPQAGDMGFLAESSLTQVSPELRDTVRGMEPSQVSVLNVGGAYMMLLLIETEPPGQRDLDTPSVRDGIRDLLMGRKGALLQAALVATARNEAEVTNFLALQIVNGGGTLELPAAGPAAAPVTADDPDAAADE